MKYIYYIYQLLVAVPVIIVATILTTLVITIGCTLGNGHFWGYYPGHVWGWIITRIFLLPVKVEGRGIWKKDILTCLLQTIRVRSTYFSSTVSSAATLNG